MVLLRGKLLCQKFEKGYGTNIMYYKVLRKNSKELISARAKRDCYSEILNKVTYKVDQWVSSGNISKLFVFNNLEDAKKFHITGEEIWECEVKNPVNYFPCASIDEIDNYWKMLNANEEISEDNLKTNIPSVLADEVKLIQKVEIDVAF